LGDEQNDERKLAMISEQESARQPTDSLARAVHWTLLVGLICSGLLLMVGLFLALLTDQLRTALPVIHVMTLVWLILQFNGVAYLQLGILLLLFTPILRVIVLAIGWSLQRDGRMALVALVVLGLLTVSIVLGAG
jgi:uncharacterized membrane protein